MARVLITAEAQTQFEELPKAVRARLEKTFVRLRDWPTVSGAKALRGDLAGHFRIRTGDYRVQFYVTTAGDEDSPQSETVVVEKVGHRDGFYEE